MKKIFTLLAVAAMAANASADVQTVDMTITWPMATSHQEPAVDEAGNPILDEAGNPTMKTVYDYALSPVVSDGLATYITAGEPVLGSEIIWKQARGINEVPFATFQPSDKVKEPTEGHTVSFQFTTNEGYTFEPTSFAYKGSVIGTDGGVYNLDYTWAGSTEMIQGGFHPNRNNEANDWFSTVNEALLPISGNGTFAVTFHSYDLANNKQIGLSEVVISGKLTGDITVSGISDVIANENAPVEYFNLQGVRVDNPANGLYIRRQGNEVSKVFVK